jgi:hypothetical protein
MKRKPINIYRETKGGGSIAFFTTRFRLLRKGDKFQINKKGSWWLCASDAFSRWHKKKKRAIYRVRVSKTESPYKKEGAKR